MPNGKGLFGDDSSTQSAIIVPHQGNDSLFYIFTTDHFVPIFSRSHKGLNYSLVNMNREGGLGDVIQKNVLLYAQTTEKLTAVRANDCSSIWVITHPLKSDEYWVYKIDDQGLNTDPMISSPRCGAKNAKRAILSVACSLRGKRGRRGGAEGAR